MRPSVSQQDFILYAILCSVSSRGKFLDDPLIPYWPDAFYVPELIRFLAGVEDFACRSAHFQLRAKFPSVVHSNAKRSCLICLCDRKISVADTEWHLLFGCQVNVEFRSKYFASLLKAPPPAANLPSSPSISSLVSHFLFARESSENIYIHLLSLSVIACGLGRGDYAGYRRKALAIFSRRQKVLPLNLPILIYQISPTCILLVILRSRCPVVRHVEAYTSRIHVVSNAHRRKLRPFNKNRKKNKSPINKNRKKNKRRNRRSYSLIFLS